MAKNNLHLDKENNLSKMENGGQTFYSHRMGHFPFWGDSIHTSPETGN